MRFVATLPKEAGRVIGGCLLGKHVVMACDGGPYILVTKGDQAVFEKIESQYGPVTPIKFMDAVLDPSKPQEVRIGRLIEWTELTAAKWQDPKTLQFELTQ